MPNWLWPTVRNERNSFTVRLGRLLHWISVLFALAIFVGALAFPAITIDGEADFRSTYTIAVPTLFALFFGGRGLRYLIAGE